jgi:hypothetical protein
MGKRTPEQRWRDQVQERYIAFTVSGERERLRREGLDLLGRAELLTPEEWWQQLGEVYASVSYRAWWQQCQSVGERFGLAPWAVEMACLLQDYQPEQQPHVVAVRWLNVQVVTESTDQLFLDWLCYHAHALGLRVVRRRGEIESPLLHVPFPTAPNHWLTPSRRPPKHSAFSMRIEYPTGYPSEARQQADRQVAGLERELLRRLGYRVAQRTRKSRLVDKASDLKIGQAKITPVETYDIVDRAYSSTDDPDDADLGHDQARRKQVGGRRHHLKQRLIVPYQTDPQDELPA